MSAHFSDPIVAPITPPGVGGVSVIRLSGDGVRAIAARFIRGVDVAGALPQSVHHGSVVDRNENRIDEILISFFNGPHSYTGEDVVEISCHGNPLIVSIVLNLLISNGTRMADPGEFTKRAFLNGRIDLSQAEAVADVIYANSASGLDISNRQLHGELGVRIRAIIDDLIKICGIIELELDFVDEGIVLADSVAISNAVNNSLEGIRRLLATYERGRLVAHGIVVAIAGKPNVGKSSLLNRIAGEERAIVSPIEGTTRDTIDIAIQHKGMKLEFWDTAGLRDTAHSIEQLGIDRTHERIMKSDIVIYIADGSRPFTEVDLREFENMIPGSKTIVAVNKCDLAQDPSIEEVLSGRRDLERISAKSGAGISQLLDRLVSSLFTGDSPVVEQVILTNQRHYDCLQRAGEALDHALGNIADKSGEFISVDLRSAIDYLGEITGRVTSDVILSSIFANFCIGK